MSYRYEKRNGIFYWITPHDEVEVGEELAIVYEENSDEGMMWTLLKHGRPDLVKKYFDTCQKSYRAGGCSDIADDLRYLVLGSKFDLEDFNKTISHTGYIRRFVRNFNLTIDAREMECG